MQMINALSELGLAVGYPHVAHQLRDLRRTQWLSRDEIEDLSWRRLQRTLKYAYDCVPFYRGKFESAGVHPEDVRRREDLETVPLPTKLELREALANGSAGFRKSSIVTSTTGSTGEPFTFPIDSRGQAERMAVVFRNIEWYGHRLGDRNARLWGREEIRRPGRHWQRNLAAWRLRLEVEVFGRRLEIITHDAERPWMSTISETTLARWCALVRRHRPKVVDGYVSSLALLADYVIRHGVDDLSCQAVVTGGEYLSQPARALLQRAFRCRVYNRYGCSEAGFMAHECGEHPEGKLHVNAEALWFELVVEGKPAAPQSLGEVVITDFTNRALPLIRYRLNDVGVVAPPHEKCPCGRGLPLIGGVQGRLNDLFVLPDGRILEPHIWVELFSYQDYVQQFRITQQLIDMVEVEVVFHQPYDEAERAHEYENLRTRVERFLPGCTVHWKEVSHIEPGRGGKARQVISYVSGSVVGGEVSSAPTPRARPSSLKPHD
jgi:phenylacetate-CoA ligase